MGVHHILGLADYKKRTFIHAGNSFDILSSYVINFELHRLLLCLFIQLLSFHAQHLESRGRWLRHKAKQTIISSDYTRMVTGLDIDAVEALLAEPFHFVRIIRPLGCSLRLIKTAFELLFWEIFPQPQVLVRVYRKHAKLSSCQMRQVATIVATT